MSDTTAGGLPPSILRYFWDYPRGNLSWDEDRETIVWRLLELGGWDAIGWVRERVPDDELREIILRKRGRGLDPKRLTFWEGELGLPHDQVQEWIAIDALNPWRRRLHA